MQEIRVFLRKEQIEKLRLTDRKTYGGYGGTTMTDYYLSRYVRYRVLEDGTIFRIEATPGELDKKKYQVSSLPSCKWTLVIHKEFISEGMIADTYFGLEKINIEIFGKRGEDIHTFEIETDIPIDTLEKSLRKMVGDGTLITTSGLYDVADLLVK